MNATHSELFFDGFPPGAQHNVGLPPSDELTAHHYLHARSWSDAEGPARGFLQNAESCPRCTRALSRIYEQIGSTLFRDDDPLDLLSSFSPEDRNGCTLRVLAACIVLKGRDRIQPTMH